MNATISEHSHDHRTNALIYTRASMDRHHLMNSTDDQEAECRSWCHQQQWEVGRVITDSNRSASQWRTREREGFAEALRLIRSHSYDAFVTWEPSRASRELATYVQSRAACQEAGVLYLTKGRVYDFSRSDDAFLMGLEFLTAEKDSAVIRERQLRTVRRNAEKGRPHGRLPFGYQRVYDKNTGALLRQEINEEQAKLIRSVVDQLLDGTPLSKIVYDMNVKGIPTPQRATTDHSRGWTNSSVRQLLKNPTLAGFRVYQGKVIGPADWPAVLSEQKWEQVNAVLADRARRTRYIEQGHHSHPKWLLSHIAKCGYCGRPLVRGIGSIRRKDGSPRNSYVCTFTGCRKISIDIPRTDEYVVGVLLGWLSAPENLSNFAASDNQSVEEFSAARKRVSALELKLQEVATAYAEDKIGIDLLSNIEKRLKSDLEKARRSLLPPMANENLNRLLSSGNLKTAWERLELVEQRRLIKTSLCIQVAKAPQSGGTFRPERIRVTPRRLPQVES